MTDIPEKPEPVGAVRGKSRAPIIFFDEAPVFQNYNGVIGITLSAIKSVPDGFGKIATEQFAVAFLRTNIQGAMTLRKSLDDALLLGAKTEGKAN